MKIAAALCALALIALIPEARPPREPAGPPPVPPLSAEDIRKEMGIPSTGRVRGQKDTVGYASTAAQMTEVWDLSGQAPEPTSLGTPPDAGVAGIICPHDDYLYAGRVYRKIIPLIRAKTVVIIGVFHGWRRFGISDRPVFEGFKAWRAPGGEIPVSGLRASLLRTSSRGSIPRNSDAHNSEHSIEAVAYWLKHFNVGVEILPILVPPMEYPVLRASARTLGKALGQAMGQRQRLGTDVAVVISADAVHYGRDFSFTPYGDGGEEAYRSAVDQDVSLMKEGFNGPLDGEKLYALLNAGPPAKGSGPRPAPAEGGSPAPQTAGWCGRASIPFGVEFLAAAAEEQGRPAREHFAVVGHPVAYATSVGWPALTPKGKGLGTTAPATLSHFVGYPAVALTLEPCS